MKDYYVTWKVEGRFTAEISANTVDEAIEKSRDKWCDADFGELEEIDGEPIVCQDNDGNYLFEK